MKFNYWIGSQSIKQTSLWEVEIKQIDAELSNLKIKILNKEYTIKK